MAEENVLDDVLDEDSEEEKAGEKTSTPDESETQPTTEERLATATATLEDLEKSNKGLLGAVKGERTQRQQLQGRLEQISETLNDIISRRKEAEEAEEKPSGIKVEVDEEGQAFVPQEAILTPLEQKLSALEEKIDKLATEATKKTEEDSREKEAQKVFDRIVAEDEAFADASRKLEGMAGWINERLFPLLEEQGVKGTTADQILDVLDDAKIETEFQKAYPGVDMERIVRAYSSKHGYRAALTHLSTTKGPDEDSEGEKATKLRELANKPSGLGGVRNQKVSTGLTLEQIAKIDADDFDLMTDDEADKILRFLEKEEQR